MDGRSGMCLNYVHKDCSVRSLSGESLLTHEDVAGANSATSPKRRRLSGKTTTHLEEVKSNVLTGQRYVDGNVVTESTKRYISNLMGASAARVVTKTEDSDNESSDESDNERFKTHAGTLGLVRNSAV